MFVRSRLLLVCVAVALLVGGGIALWRWSARLDSGAPSRVVALRETPQLVVALAGDALIVKALPAQGTDAGFDAVTALLKGTTLGIANLEQNLLDTPPASDTTQSDGSRWPHGNANVAADLARAGFTVLSCANNHAVDYGIDGLKQTLRIFQNAGLAHTGCGDDLGQARRALVLGDRPRRVAVIAVASSVSGASRAAPTRGDIQGRAGVSSLRYVPDITVDAKTFATLRQSFLQMQMDVGNRDDVVMLSGTPIKKGERTVVEVLPNEQDVADIVAEVQRVRPDVDAVIVSLHAHEPSNYSEGAAEFVKTFAHRAIDAGGDVVFAHGPHQLRGIERYGRGVILYSLGNLAFDHTAVASGAHDVYESGADLYEVILSGAMDGRRQHANPPALEKPIWWEGLIAVAAFGSSGLDSVRLHPIDLGVNRSLQQRGVPRLPEPQHARTILERVANLSKPLNTAIDIDDGTATVRLKD